MMSFHHRLSGSLILDKKSVDWLVNHDFTGLLKSGYQGKHRDRAKITFLSLSQVFYIRCSPNLVWTMKCGWGRPVFKDFMITSSLWLRSRFLLMLRSTKTNMTSWWHRHRVDWWYPHVKHCRGVAPPQTALVELADIMSELKPKLTLFWLRLGHFTC